MRTETVAVLLLGGVAVFVAMKLGAIPGIHGVVDGPSVRDRIFALPGQVPQAEVDRAAKAIEKQMNPGVSAAQGAISGAVTGTTVMPGWGTLIGAGAGFGASFFM